MENSSPLSRRSFLGRTLAASTAVTAVSFPAASREAGQAQAGETKILNQQEGMVYRRLPNTDMHLSAISLGGGEMDQAGDIFHYAIERGANFIITSLGYREGQSMRTIGKTMKADRDKVYLAIQDDFRKGSLEDALKMLNTDHLDFLMFSRHSPEEAKDPKILEQFEKWKKEGKVRFAGLTTHDKVKDTTAAAIESGMYSVVMPSLDPNALVLLEEEMKKAVEKKVGVMAMKSMKGLKDQEMQTAYVKKALGNPALTSIIKGFNSFETFDAFVKAAREGLTRAEDTRLYQYANATRRTNCMMCGECSGVCPNGIAVSTLLRCSDYYLDQCGNRELALAAYRELAGGCRPEACESCGKCEQVCPNGIAIRERLQLCQTRMALIA